MEDLQEMKLYGDTWTQIISQSTHTKQKIVQLGN